MHGSCKFNLQVAIDHYGFSMHSGQYTASVLSIVVNEQIIEREIIETANSSTAVIDTMNFAQE